MGAFADTLTEELVDELEDRYDEIGSEIVADIRESISIPVLKVGEAMTHEKRNFIVARLPYSESDKVVRSKVGEPPRRETGDLWLDVQMEVSQDGLEVTLEVYQTLFYAWILEGKLDRPYFGPAYERWKDRIAGLVNPPNG